MEVLWIPVIELIIGIIIAIAIRDGKKDTYPYDTEPVVMEDKEGERVRWIVFKAYRGMLRQHAHGLHLLTACLSRDAVATNVALYALTETEKSLTRFNTRPIRDAIDEIKGEGE